MQSPDNLKHTILDQSNVIVLHILLVVLETMYGAAAKNVWSAHLNSVRVRACLWRDFETMKVR